MTDPPSKNELDDWDIACSITATSRAECLNVDEKHREADHDLGLVCHKSRKVTYKPACRQQVTYKKDTTQ